ncbi:MAG: FAD-dependent thymidylate synthase [Candidatus Niyogibacteria bacterium]|nr:FAD-dependent thymidylate synthase [Candidatus Niyogibacteria bacterium]
MRKVKPKIFLIGETKIDDVVLQDYLHHVGAPKWKTDAPSDSEKVIEVMGRMCYRSFAPGLNPNVTKVREGNAAYLQHILEVGHGSVLEHANFNFIFADVSRVFTHELVRHRAGTAMSQESLRFVRLDDLGFWLPTVVREDAEVMEIFVRTVAELEALQKLLAKKYDIDGKMPFSKKKQITSAMRRIAPSGLATSIGWSANGRALRHVIEMRTDPGAEEEIRLVFGKVAEMMVKKCPNLMSGYDIEMVDGLPWYKTSHKKV